MSTELTCRRIAPEILDDLSADDPRAIASRHDLIRINALMFHVGMMVRLLRRHVSVPPAHILEIGAGDGTFMLKVARRLATCWPRVKLTLLDRVDLVTRDRREDFAKLGWQVEPVTADVFEWLAREDHPCFEVTTANLFLHHFTDADLATLLSKLRPQTSVFLATEPRRCRLALSASRLLRAIGANEVTQHDAPASVRAGFRGAEISSLWPDVPGSFVEEWRAGPFTHVFTATDISSGARA